MALDRTLSLRVIRVGTAAKFGRECASEYQHNQSANTNLYSFNSCEHQYDYVVSTLIKRTPNSQFFHENYYRSSSLLQNGRLY